MPTEVLVVGLGSIGERHVRCLAAAGANVSICETNDRLRETVCARYGIRQAYASVDAVLSAYQPDCAVIATPASSHIPIATRLAMAGVHLLIEKPLSTTMDGVEALADLVRRKHLVAGVAYVYRCHPALAAMRAALKTGRFGKPLQLVCIAGQHFPTFRPAYRDTYYADRAAGGGAVQDALTHVLNAAEWLVGPITRLVADVAHLALPDVNVEDTANVLAHHADGVLSVFTLNQHQSPNEVMIRVVCGGGTVQFEYHNQQWRWMNADETQWHEEPTTLETRDTLFTLQAQAFLAAVGRTETLPCSLDEGIVTLKANLHVLRSAELGEWIALR